jgi:hypothetical protein
MESDNPVTRCTRNYWCVAEESRQPTELSLPNEDSEGLTADALEESPFHCVRLFASATKYAPTTVWRDLHSMGYVVENFQLVPHTLSTFQQTARVEMAIWLRKVIESAKNRGWRFLLTGDES